MIIRQTDTALSPFNKFSLYPNQFVPDSEKQKDVFIKNTLDFFAQLGFSQYQRNRESFAKNYDLLKGIISWEDFYDQGPEVKDFMTTLTRNQPLPPYVKHYPLLNPPLNTMVGELTKRPDGHRVRAFDEDSRSEELSYKTTLVQQLILQQAKQQIIQEQGLSGEQVSPDDLEQLTQEKVQDDLTDYTSLAEQWGNHTLTALKAELGMRDKSEEAFRDLLITSREFFHLFEDNSKRGFSLEVENAKNVFHSPLNDKKYSRDWYYGGVVKAREISECLERYPWLTKEEVDHLVKQLNEGQYLLQVPSNFDTGATGPESINYTPYSRLIQQEKTFLELELQDPGAGKDAGFSDLLAVNGKNAPLSYVFATTEVYFLSKKLVGKLTYQDQDGTEQVVMVDESYEEGSPGELDIEWGWVNQWMKGVRIGTEIYHLEPFTLLDYCPIIGVIHEVKNTQARSLVDLMKPFQAIYNVCMNQLWRLLEKEIGVVYNISLRKIPTPKDGDSQDALDIWESEARERGVTFEDDSPENMKSPGGNTNLSRAIDLSRTQEIKSRYELATMIKNECWQLVGMNAARLGEVAATQTATGTQTELTQSYAQTEPWFAQHENVLDQVYQALLDAAQTIESTKDVSTLSYITGAGESAFLQVTAPDIKLRDLHVFPTHNAEDIRLFNEIRQLSQPMLQNGAPAETIIDLYSTNSIRQMKRIAKSLREKQEQMAQQQQQMEQQKMEQEQQQFQAAQQEAARQKELDRINQNINLEKDRMNKLEVAEVQAMGHAKDITEDSNADGVPDLYQVQDLTLKADSQRKAHEADLMKLQLEREKLLQQGQHKTEDLKRQDRSLTIQEKNQKNDLEIQKIKLKEAKIKLQQTRNKPKSK